jgi:hypothetical protein
VEESETRGFSAFLISTLRLNNDLEKCNKRSSLKIQIDDIMGLGSWAKTSESVVGFTPQHFDSSQLGSIYALTVLKPQTPTFPSWIVDCQTLPSHGQYFARSWLDMTLPSLTTLQSCHARSEGGNRGHGVALSDTLIGALTAGVGGYRPHMPQTVTSMNASRSNHQTLVQIMDEALSIMEEDDEELLRMLAQCLDDSSLPSN